MNSLLNDKILDRSNDKILDRSDDKISLNEKLKLVLQEVENIVEKGENAGSHMVFSFRVVKSRNCVVIN